MMQGQFILANLLMLILIMFMLNGCGGQDETGGATAALTWSPVISSSPISYTVHYGKYSSGQPGSCDYEDSVDVPGPQAEVTGLEYNAPYYFAVSAFNGQRSSCSMEVFKQTPPLTLGQS